MSVRLSRFAFCCLAACAPQTLEIEEQPADEAEVSASETLPDTGGRPRNVRCRESSYVLHYGDSRLVRGTDPAFNWLPQREQLFGLKNGECMWMPFWVRAPHSMHLAFVAPLQEVNARLAEHGLEAIPVSEMGTYGLADPNLLAYLGGLTQNHSNPNLRVNPADFSQLTFLGLAMNDFAETSAGTIHPSHIYAWVKPSKRCALSEANCNLPGMFTWRYYVDSMRAKWAGKQTWGMLKLIGAGYPDMAGAQRHYSYFDAEKRYPSKAAARVYDIVWDTTKRNTSNPIHTDPTLTALRAGIPAPTYNILGVTQRHKNTGALKHSPGQTFNKVVWGASTLAIDLYDPADTLDLNPNSDLAFFDPFRGLSRLTPFMWQLYSDSKVVWHTDEPR